MSKIRFQKNLVHAAAVLAAGAAFSGPAAAAPATPDALADAFCAALVAEDADAMTALYVDDADSYGPGGDVSKGRAQIAASWAPFFESFDDLTCTLDKAGGVEEGPMAAAWGLWTLTGTPAEGGDTVVMKGRYTDVSRKSDDGWRYVNDHASMLAEPLAGDTAE